MKTRLIGAILAVLLTVGGTVLLTGYVQGAEARAANGAALVPVYVVQSEIPQGTPAGELPAFISENRVPARLAAAGRVTNLAQVAGLVASTTLLPGGAASQRALGRPGSTIAGADDCARRHAGDQPRPADGTSRRRPACARRHRRSGHHRPPAVVT